MNSYGNSRLNVWEGHIGSQFYDAEFLHFIDEKGKSVDEKHDEGEQAADSNEEFDGDAFRDERV